MERIDEIINQGLKFYNKLREDENGRYKYCYKIFNDAHKSNNVDENFIDYLCLHLSFYLASWGMYRGSSFLLQRDYKVHKEAIKVILEKKYDSLWGINVNEYLLKDNQDKLNDIVIRLKNIYNEIRLRVKETIPQNDVSDTLITKILMGTFGCVPAYDRYFIAGIRNEKAATGIFNINSVLDLVDFYNSHYNKFENARNINPITQVKNYDMKYPQMKILDSCFWQIGFDLDENKGLKISH